MADFEFKIKLNVTTLCYGSEIYCLMNYESYDGFIKLLKQKPSVILHEQTNSYYRFKKEMKIKDDDNDEFMLVKCFVLERVYDDEDISNYIKWELDDPFMSLNLSLGNDVDSIVSFYKDCWRN